MKPINWNPEKNQLLIAERGISFEDIVFSLQQGTILDDVQHPNANKYANQRIIIVALNDYAYLGGCPRIGVVAREN